jgi:hypothetical protein
LGLQNGQRFPAAIRVEAFVAAAHKDSPEEIAYTFVIVHTQNFCHLFIPWPAYFSGASSFN